MILKNCPMCNRNSSADNAIQEAAVDLHQVSTPLGKKAYEVQCTCGVRGPRDLDRIKAIEGWNLRVEN